MKPITAIVTGLLIAAASLPALAGQDIVNQALQATQNNYSGNAATYLKQHGIEATDQDVNLFNQYRNNFNRAD